MNLPEEIATYKSLGFARQTTANLILEAVSQFEADYWKIQRMQLKPEDKKLTLDGLLKALRSVMQKVVGDSAPCECRTSPADTGPFPAMPATDAVQPSPGPWTFEQNPLCVDGTPLIATIKDRDGKIVEGLIACNSPFLSDQGHANVAAVLAVPTLIAALREIAAQTSSLPMDYEARAAELLNDLSDLIERIASKAIAAATPIQRKPATPEGGAA